MPVSAKKQAYHQKWFEFINEYTRIVVVSVDNVGSKQLQDIRMALRGKAELVMGKNTTIRFILRDFLAQNPDHPIAALEETVSGNVGFIFTNNSVSEVQTILEENVVPAAARVGSIAPVDVFVEAGPTGCDPGQTSWFQALNIATKIVKGSIEIVSRLHLIREGEKVGESEAALLTKLGYAPFTYGCIIESVYDNGTLYDAAVLKLSENDLLNKFASGVRAVAALGMEIGYPTLASLPHSINRAFKSCLAVAIETDFSFPKSKEFEEFIANPSAFITAAPAAAGGNDAAAAEEEEESSEAESVGAGGLFGGDDDDDDW